MAIAEPFCETYKPSVRTDGSCYWDEEPTVNSAKQSCNAKEEDKEERIIFWDSLFNTVHKNASVVTEFNLVTRHLSCKYRSTTNIGQVCERYRLRILWISFSGGGSFLGSILIAILADIYGRRPAMLLVIYFHFLLCSKN